MSRIRVERLLVIGVSVWMAVGLARAAGIATADEGIAALGAGRFEEALVALDAALATAPDAPDTHYFRAATLNRLGRFAEALAVFRRLERAGWTAPDLDFELGWALLGTGRCTEALDVLGRADTASPERGQTREFLGRCRLALGQFDGAEADFAEAVRRDPALAPTVSLYRAALAQKRGDVAAAEAHLGDALVADPLLARGLRARLGLPDREAGKPWHVGVSVTLGYNDNVIALGDTIPLPADITDEGAWYLRLGANAGWRHDFGAGRTASVGYAFLADVYDDLDRADTLDHYWYAQYRQPLARDWQFAIRVADEYTQIDGEDFRNQWHLRPALLWRWAPDAATELSYQHGRANYWFDTPAVQERDGALDSVSLTQHLRWRPLALDGAIGVTHARIDAEGGDFEHHADSLFARIGRTLPWNVRGEIAYAYTASEYDNPNSFTGFTAARDDDTQSVSVVLSRPLGATGRVHAGYTRTWSDSNIPFFEYAQNVWMVGAMLGF